MHSEFQMLTGQLNKGRHWHKIEPLIPVMPTYTIHIIYTHSPLLVNTA